jgi:hypothetical protein
MATSDQSAAQTEAPPAGTRAHEECTERGICDACFKAIREGDPVVVVRYEDSPLWGAYCSDLCADGGEVREALRGDA